MKIPIQKAVQLLKNDAVVAIPTETVYGLAASLHSEHAIHQIYTLKNRPASNPLIIHIEKREDCEKYLLSLPPQFEKLTNAFWPGPLTLVMPVKTEMISETVRAGLPTAAFRVPKHPLTREILSHIGPLVAPSANLSGKPSATTREHVETDFGIDFPVLDGGACQHGVESTIIAYVHNRWEIARFGAISSKMLEAVLGYCPVSMQAKEKPICPGQLLRHYAPKARLTLSKNPTGSVIVGFSDRIYKDATKIFSLGHSSDYHGVAASLYATLRALDSEGITRATVDTNFPEDELWHVIHERLLKAAN